MDIDKIMLLPPQQLAIAYAPAELRPHLSLLLEFDARLADIAAKSSEPLIGQMKLAWWRDAITVLPDMRPKAEPLLARLKALAGRGVEPALLELIDAWEMKLVGGHSDAFAMARGRAIFSTYARWVGDAVDVEALGARWAADSVARGSQTNESHARLPSARELRPLTILALSVRDVSGPRLLWHALTGR